MTISLGAGVVIDMDQSSNLEELSYLLQLVNMTKHSENFNFSDAVAFQLVKEYVDNMYTIAEPSTIALLVLYIPTFLFSLTGNSLVIYVVFRNQHMRRVKNLFLVNIAFADLAVTLLCFPMVAGQTVFRLWVYGDFMCRVTGYVQGIAVTCSIFSLTSLSIDRLLAIKAPFNCNRIGRKCQAIRVIVGLWIIAGISAIPLLFVRTLFVMSFDDFNIELKYCIERWDSHEQQAAYAVTLLLLTYLLPILLILICYTLIGKTLCAEELHRKTSDNSSTVVLGRKKVARMLIALIAVFVVCWLPYNVVSLSLDLRSNYTDTRVLPFSLWLGHAHSAMNPILYWFLNRSFRHCMRKALCCSHLPGFARDSPSPHVGDDIGDLIRFDFRRERRSLNGDPTTLRNIRLQLGEPRRGGGRAPSYPSRSTSDSISPRRFICLGISPADTTSSRLQASSTPRDEGSAEDKLALASPSVPAPELRNLVVHYSALQPPPELSLSRTPSPCRAGSASPRTALPRESPQLPAESNPLSSSYFESSTVHSGSIVDSHTYSADV